MNEQNSKKSERTKTVIKKIKKREEGWNSRVATFSNGAAIPDYDRNSYSVTIEFYVVNTPTELVDLTVFLERLR